MSHGQRESPWDDLRLSRLCVVQALLDLCIGAECPKSDDQGVLLEQGQDLGELIENVVHWQRLSIRVCFQRFLLWIPLHEAEAEVVGVLPQCEVLELEESLH